MFLEINKFFSSSYYTTYTINRRSKKPTHFTFSYHKNPCIALPYNNFFATETDRQSNTLFFLHYFKNTRNSIDYTSIILVNYKSISKKNIFKFIDCFYRRPHVYYFIAYQYYCFVCLPKRYVAKKN